MFNRYFITLSLLIITVSYGQQLPGDVVQVGTITSSELNEISGIDVSQMNEDLLWCINDRGNKPILYGITSEGELKKRYYVRPVKNNDWEDIVTFSMGDTNWILIADVGDNDAERHHCQLLLILEPRIQKAENEYISPKVTLRFQYEDGPRDCESVAVDVAGQRILLISKRTPIPILYSLPLTLTSSSTPMIARRITTLDQAPRPTEAQKKENRLFRYGGQPTAMDYSENSKLAVILTYRDFWIYEVASGDWQTALSGLPVSTTLPLMRQAESICFDEKGIGLYFTTEKVPAPLYYLRLKDVK